MCRAYARYFVGDKHADSVMCFFCALYFWRKHGYWPHFNNPRSFEEKLCWRMLFDRNPLWTILSDKLRVRNYVASKVGSEYLVPLLWNGDDTEEIPFDELPMKFVIKATHGCHYNIIVRNKTQLDQAKARRQLKKWLGENYCQDRWLGKEWAYKNIRPTIIVESFLDDNGNVPVDYKFFCFSGRVEFFKVDFDRFEDHSEKFFDKDCNPLDLFEQGINQYRGKILHPDNFYEMFRVAETLSQSLDFIRVDLYSLGNLIYVGELTCYPGGGITRWIPEKYDFIFGEKWDIR